jgi:SAM-dependent methyltransferase
MERISRGPFQGVKNIIRFNWHFYVIAILFIAALICLLAFAPDAFAPVIYLIIIFALLSTALSLAASYYVYDYTELYALDWLNELEVGLDDRLVNIHAGFDETSMLLSSRYPGRMLTVLDFYNSYKHTEVSIERARRAYPAYPGTRIVDTTDIQLQAGTIDLVFVLLSAHEIRNKEERCTFFRELRQSLRTGGSIVVLEHLRDLPNFLVYNFGYLHFFPRKEWLYTFESAGFSLISEKKVTPFLSAFILQSDGTTS